MPWLDEEGEHVCDTPDSVTMYRNQDPPKVGRHWQCGSCSAIWVLSSWVSFPNKAYDVYDRYHLSFRRQGINE